MDPNRHPDTWSRSTLYAEDLSPGEGFALGSHTVTADEITAFAQDWDPQYFHLDAAAAEGGPFHGLIASGVHTLAVLQRLSVAGFWGRCATIAARGMSEVRFLAPVRPDTLLVGRIVVEEVQHRDPTRSLVSVSGTLEDSRATVVLAASIDAYVARRPGG